MNGLKRRLLALFEQYPLRLVFLLTLALLPLIVAMAWLYAGEWATRQADQLVQANAAELENRRQSAVQDFDSALKILRGLPDYLADDSVIVAAVANRDTRQLNLVNQFLARYAASFEVDAVFVLDASGECVAASNYDQAERFVGQRYADRRYFTEALFGRHGSQFAVGRITNVPGFFFSSPIFQGEGRVGVVVVKVNAPRLERRVRLQHSLIADEQGVVVMAENHEYLYRLMPDAPLLKQSAVYRDARYKRVNFEPLDLTLPQELKSGGLRLLDGQLVAFAQHEMVEAGFFLYLYQPIAALKELPVRRRTVFSATAAGGAILIWAVCATLAFYLRSRLYQQRIEQSNEALSRLNRILHQQATHDALTGCLNRRALNEALEREMVRAKRYGLPLCLAMIDIDFFKKVNDDYGHQVGDQALRHLSEQVSLRIRQCDLFARYGGEEFVLLMPGTTLDNAMLLLDRIRVELARIPVPGVVPPLHLAFSAGVVAYDARFTIAELLGRADAALYRAKQEGRNRVVDDGSPAPL